MLFVGRDGEENAITKANTGAELPVAHDLAHLLASGHVLRLEIYVLGQVSLTRIQFVRHPQLRGVSRDGCALGASTDGAFVQHLVHLLRIFDILCSRVVCRLSSLAWKGHQQ